MRPPNIRKKATWREPREVLGGVAKWDGQGPIIDTSFRSGSVLMHSSKGIGQLKEMLLGRGTSYHLRKIEVLGLNHSDARPLQRPIGIIREVMG